MIELKQELRNFDGVLQNKKKERRSSRKVDNKTVEMLFEKSNIIKIALKICYIGINYKVTSSCYFLLIMKGIR